MKIKRPKVLCFTTSYNRPYHLYNCINSILNQSYKYITHSVGICTNKDIDSYRSLLSSHISDKRLELSFHDNLSQHENYLYPIKTIEYQKYDIFIKIDDDDIYKKEYIENMVTNYLKYKKDVLSAYIKYQLNNNHLYKGKFDNVGGHWHEDLKSKTKFGMPFTYVFNQKALQVLLNTTSDELGQIHIFEDAGWRRKWRENKITSKVLESIDSAIYNIHGQNISSKHCLIDKTIEDKIYITYKNFDLAYFMHYGWQSYCFIDKKNNRVFNIENNHYGKFDIDKNNIIINWDNYGKEIFKLDSNKIYQYIQ